jgi:hypothetical protein
VPLPGSGIIALTDISTEFGGTAPHALSEYYRDGVYSDGISIPAGETSIPASGPISFSDFYGTSAAAPVYTLTPSSSFVNEGTAVQFTFGGTDLPDGTVYFSIAHGTTSNADFTVTPPQDGSRTAVTITSGIYSPTSVSLTLDADAFTDGSSETFTAYTHDANTGGTQLATSGVITVADTSLTPAYVSAAVTASIDEFTQSTATFTVNTSGVVDGTTVGYTITGISVADISLVSLTGIITINSNIGTLTFDAVADLLTEGPEVATITLDATDSVGTATGSLADTVTIDDTSTSPISYDSVAFSPTAINEDGATNTTFTVNTSNVVDGTTVGYTITGVTVADISLVSLTGNITITGNTGTVVFNAIADTTTEGSEVATLTLAATDSVGTSTGSLSDTVTINDTSTAAVNLNNITSDTASIDTSVGTVYAGFRFTSDGTGDRLQSEGSISWGPNGNWYTPTTGGIGSSYEIYATLDSHTNAPGGGGTMNTWINLSTDPEWSLSTPNAGVDKETYITYQIRDAGTLSVLSTRTFYTFVGGLA